MGPVGPESHLTGHSGAWIALHGSSDSGSNPALLGKGIVPGCRATFRAWGSSSSIMSSYSVWDIPVSIPCPNYEMVKHRTTRCLGGLLWDSDVPLGWTSDALSVCRSFPSIYWCRRHNVATLHFIQGATAVYVTWGTKLTAAKSHWRRWRWVVGRLVLLLLGEDPSRFGLQELKWPLCYESHGHWQRDCRGCCEHTGCSVCGFPSGHSPHSFVNIIKARTYLVLIQSQPLQGDWLQATLLGHYFSLGLAGGVINSMAAAPRRYSYATEKLKPMSRLC